MLFVHGGCHLELLHEKTFTGTPSGWVPITTKGGSLSSPYAFHNCDAPNYSDGFSCITKIICPSNFQVWKDGAPQSRSSDDGSQKQMGERWTHGRLLCGWRLPFHIQDLESYSTSSPRITSNIMSQLLTCHIVHALTLRKCHLNIWERKENKCIANIFTMCLDFCVRWITIVTSSFTLQHTPTMRLCDSLNLQVL